MQTRTSQPSARAAEPARSTDDASPERAAPEPGAASGATFEFGQIDVLPRPSNANSRGDTPGDLGDTSGGGAPLSGAIRAQMERAYKTDFSSITIFDGSPLADAHGVDALTHGDAIHVNRSAPGPAHPARSRLLGHELAHVVQRRQGRVTGALHSGGSLVNSDTALEREADLAGIAAARGEAPDGLSVARGAAAQALGPPVIQYKRKINDAPEPSHFVKLVPGQFTRILEPGFDLPLSARVGSQSAPLESLESEEKFQKERDRAKESAEAFLRIYASPESFHPGAGAAGTGGVGPDSSEREASDFAALTDAGRDVAKSLFRERHGYSLRDYILQTHKRDTGLVRLLALLAWGHEKGDEVDVGLAIIPYRTHQSDVPRVISKVPVAGRPRLIERYGRAFRGIGIGADDAVATALTAHLHDALGGALGYLTNDDDVDLARALTLLDHDLTTAEKVYFDSLAVRGTRTKEVLELLQGAWASGFAEFDAIVRDWEALVRSRQGWTDKSGSGWTTRTLKEAMIEELSFEDRDLVLAIFRAYERGKEEDTEREKRPERGAEAAADAQARHEDLQIQAAYDGIQAAAGSIGALTNDEQIQKSVRTINAVWQARIARAKAAGDEALGASLERQWRAARDELAERTGRIPTSDDQAKITRLLVEGGDSLLDSVWVDCQLGHYAEAIKALTKGWIQGKGAELHRDARTERKSPSGEVLRPKVAVELLIPGIDAQFWRFSTLASDSASNPNPVAGANRLVVELGGPPGGVPAPSSDADAELASVYEYLQMFSVLNPALRTNVLAAFLSRLNFVRGDASERAPEKQFILYLGGRFEHGNNFEKLRALLQPAATPQEKAAQARRELNARETGRAAGLLRDVTDAYAEVTGERERYVTERSLILIEDLASSSPEQQLEAAGATRVDDLLARRAAVFEERLDAYTSVQTTVAQAVAGSVELAFELAISALTGGQGIFAVISSVGSTLLNKFTSEALLGANYQLYSPANVRDVIVAAVSSALDELVDIRGVLEKQVEFESSLWFERQVEKGAKAEERAKILGNAAQNFAAGIADGTINAVTAIASDALLAGKYPTPEAMAAEMRKLFIASISRAAHAPGTAFSNPGSWKDDALPFDKRLKANVKFKEFVKLTEGTAKKLNDLLASDTGNLTVWEMLDKVVSPEIKGLATAYLKAYASAKGQSKVATARLQEVNEILGDDKEAYEGLARVLAHGMNLELSYAQHQRGGEAQHRSVLREAQAEAKQQGKPAPTRAEELIGTERAKKLKEIASDPEDYAHLKKQNDARLLLLEFRKLYGEEDKPPIQTRRLIKELLHDRTLRVVEKEWRSIAATYGIDA